MTTTPRPDSASRFTDFDIESVVTGKNDAFQRPPSRKQTNNARRRFPYFHTQSSHGVGRFGGDQFTDYEQRYPPDEYGREMGPNARVWHVYLDEADKYDAEMILGFKDTTDVLLVFAGLFSAVVTTFVVQASQALQPNYAEINASLLTELVALQRAAAAGTSPSDVPISALNAFSNTTTAVDRWVNGLWFTSLSFALASALIAVLVKQWLQHYISALSGTPRDRVLLRHFRFKGLNRWRIPVIVDLLPVLLHISLFMFFAGLALFIWPMDIIVTGATIAVSGSAYSFYMLTNILSFIYPDCAYKNPVSQCFQHLHLGKKARNLLRGLHKGPILVSDLHTTTLPVHEDDYVHAAKQMDELLAEALVWLRSASSNPSGITIVSQAVAGIPFNFASSHIIQQSLIQNSVEREFISCFDPNTEILLPNMSGRAEVLFRSLTVTGTSLSESSLIARIQKLEESLVKTAHPRRLSIKAVSIITHRYLSPTTRTYTTTSLYESLLSLLHHDVELPPSLWESLFYVLIEQSISGTFALSPAYHHVNEKSIDFVGKYGHHVCGQRAKVIVMLVHLLTKLSENDHLSLNPVRFTANWALPGNISLAVLCQSERGMTVLILRYLSHHLVYGDSHALAVRVLEQSSDEEVLSRCTEILTHSLRFVLSLLQQHSQRGSFFSDGDILTSFEQTLFDMASKSPISPYHSILVETMHRFGEFAIEIEGIDNSIPRLIRLLDIDNLNDRVQPMVSRSSLVVLTTYYLTNVLSHPWPMDKSSILTESDAGVLLNRLFAVRDVAVYDALRELRGLSHFRRCFPIDFTSESIWMQSFYPWMAKAFTHYIRFVTTAQSESTIDSMTQEQYLEEVFEPDALSWFLWLQLFIDGPGPVDGILSALSQVRFDDPSWRSAIQILVDTLHRDAAFYGTWNTTPDSGPWIPTKSYRTLQSIIHHIHHGLSDEDSEWILYQYVSIPHFEDNQPDIRARLELRIEGRLVYGPYAIRFMETEPAPASASSSMLDVALRKSLDDHRSLRQKKDWINRVGKSLNTVLRTSHDTGDEISFSQIV